MEVGCAACSKEDLQGTSKQNQPDHWPDTLPEDFRWDFGGSNRPDWKQERNQVSLPVIRKKDDTDEEESGE